MRGVKKSSTEARRVTVRDIALRAQVPISAVSSVLNNCARERRISQQTIDKVHQAVAELGFIPNISARKLRGGEAARNQIIIALITSFEAPLPMLDPYVLAFREVIAEGVPHLSSSALSLAIEVFSAGELKDLPGLLDGSHFNAAIITNTVAADDTFLASVRLPYPAVLINRKVPGYAAVLDDPESGAHAARVMNDLGIKRPAILFGHPLTQVSRQRIKTFLDASRKGTVQIEAKDLHESSGFQAVQAALAERKIDGIYTVTDSLALGAYKAIRRAGLVVSKDVTVISVGDYHLSSFFDPPLSHVGVSHLQLAREASRMLLSRLGRPVQPAVQVIIPSECALQGEEDQTESTMSRRMVKKATSKRRPAAKI